MKSGNTSLSWTTVHLRGQLFLMESMKVTITHYSHLNNDYSVLENICNYQTMTKV